MNEFMIFLKIIIQAGLGFILIANSIWLYISTKELKFKSVYMETLNINQKQQPFDTFKEETSK